LIYVDSKYDSERLIYVGHIAAFWITYTVNI
jgi:hypothetical protein